MHTTYTHCNITGCYCRQSLTKSQIQHLQLPTNNTPPPQSSSPPNNPNQSPNPKQPPLPKKSLQPKQSPRVKQSPTPKKDPKETPMPEETQTSITPPLHNLSSPQKTKRISKSLQTTSPAQNISATEAIAQGKAISNTQKGAQGNPHA